MTSPAALLAERLSRDAEGVCRQYLSSGRRNGRYWLVGDVDNNPGRSLFVRLAGPGVVGKWTDTATGQHGDLLDLIRLNRKFHTLREVLDEARAYLSDAVALPAQPVPVLRNSPAAARRLFAASVPIIGTPAATYLRKRGITSRIDWPALRFHPRCYYRGDDVGASPSFPAIIAAVTEVGGHVTGVHRTWLMPDGSDKAPVSDPRRALGLILGNAVRFGRCTDVLAVGEGIETVLALRSLLPDMPMAAALSANHLALMHIPPTVQRLYVAADNDPAGRAAAERLIVRADVMADARVLLPVGDDWNRDLHLGPERALQRAAEQLHPDDLARFVLRRR